MIDKEGIPMTNNRIDEDYQKACAYILDIPKFSGKHTMEETRAFYEFLGEPCRKKRIIHVAGTNGKGSVCMYLRNVLETADYHTAVFVSPHLVSIRERFLFDGEMADRSTFLGAYEQVRRQIREFERKKEHYHPSFFEFLFFMFVLMEQTKEADYIILETGLGGRLDATNCMPEKLLSVITRIGLDHTEYLGDSVTQIAGEKAGIMRARVPVVFAAEPPEAAAVVQKRAKELEACAYPVGNCDFKIERIQDKSIAFSFHSVYYNSISVILRTTALYQVENAAIALRAVDILNARGAAITKEQIQQGMQRMHWAGRMEEIMPEVYLDGAHNEDGIRAFLTSVCGMSGGMEQKSGSNHLLFAVVQDKHYEQMIRMIADSGVFDRITITTTGGSRGTDPEAILSLAKKYYRGECNCYESAEEAFDACMKGRKDKERIYIAGSLYLAGQIKAHIGRNSDD